MTVAELCRELKKYPDTAKIVAHIDKKSRIQEFYIFSYSEAYNELTIHFPKGADADFLHTLRKVWNVEIIKR